MKKAEIFKYVLTLIITIGLFVTIFYVTDLANARRATALRDAQDTIAINLLSSETQFTLLDSADCSTATDNGGLFQSDLQSIQDHLTSLESSLGTNDVELSNLKKYYALLELKDYLLVGELAARCKFTPATIVYFNNAACGTDCDKQTYVLSQLSQQYPQLRVYSFDTDLNLAAVNTLQSISKIPATLPAIIIDGHDYDGFQSLDDIMKNDPELAKMAAQAKAAAAAGQTNTSATPSSTAPSQ
jgi:hypothetical protein